MPGVWVNTDEASLDRCHESVYHNTVLVVVAVVYLKGDQNILKYDHKGFP